MTDCVICAREAEHGYLDAACFSRLSSMLRDIEDESAILETVPSMAIRTGSGGGSLASQRSPVVLDAIVATDPRRGLMRWASMDSDDLKAFDPMGLDDTASVLETLHSRARTVAEECGEPLPETATISGERDYLTRQLPWIARQPWVDEFFTEMKELLSQLQRTNKTRPARAVGFCHLPRFGSVCGGPIWQREEERLIWRVKTDRCAREKIKVSDGPAYCERCRAQWDGKELDRLRLIEEQRQAELARPKTEDGRRMLTAQEMADRLRCSVNAVRIIVSRKRIPNVRGHYDPEWFADKDAA